MNICVFCGNMSLGGGTQHMAQLLATQIVNIPGYNVSLLDIGNVIGESFFFIPASVRLDHLPNVALWDTIIKLRRYLKCHHIDILIDVDVMLGIYSFPATIATHTKVVSWEMFNLGNNIGSTKTDFIRQYANLFGAYYVTLTKTDMWAFKKRFRIRKPITYIHNPVTLPNTIKSYDRSSKIIMTAGHYYHTKGFDLAVDVASHVLPKHPDWKWLIYGDGPEEDRIREKIDRMGLSSKVIMMPRTKDILSAYQSAAIYVMTSRLEGFGLVLVEAKQCNLPTVSFDCECGPREIIQDGIDGFLIPAFDIEKMANALESLIVDDTLRYSFSQHASDNLELFSIETFRSKWLNVLDYLSQRK